MAADSSTQTIENNCGYLVVKIASRCNLNCTYCYMYNLADQSYLLQPKVMSEKVLDALLLRVKNHCLKFGLTQFIFGLHGGEPLLAGKPFFRMFTKKVLQVLNPIGVEVFISVQTNGVLITQEWCDLFAELGIHVGVSLDGDKKAHDRSRLDHKGRGSYDRTVRGLHLLQQMAIEQGTHQGVLCVLDINSNPVKVYNHFKELGITWFDMLLPDANYDHPIPLPEDATHYPSQTPYADWLIDMFDVWFEDRTSQRPKIRILENIVRQVLGSYNSTDSMGESDVDILVIETDGGIEALDVLKICGESFTKQGTSVLTHELEDTMNTGLAYLYKKSHTMLCKTCLNCPVREICGGGYLPHRYSRENGFNNPSIYCKDLIKLITHIRNRVLNKLPATFVESYGLEPMSYEEALALVADVQFLVDAESPYEAELAAFSQA